MAPGDHGWSNFLTYGHLLRTNAAKFPNKEAVIDGLSGKTLTHKELYTEACRLANGLLDLRLARGDHIYWMSYDKGWGFELYAGPALAGISQTPMNYRFTPAEAVTQIKHCEPKAIIFQEDFTDFLEQIRPQVPKVKQYICITVEKKAPEWAHDYWEMKAKSSDRNPEERVGEITPDDLFIIMYTAGTTGYPKGVMHSHSSALSYGICFADQLDFARHTRFLFLMPLYHWGGYQIPFVVVWLGGTTVICPYEPERSWEMTEKYKINQVLMAPSMWVMSLAVPDFKQKWDVPSLKRLSSGAAPLLTSVTDRIFEAFPDAEFNDCYTATEAPFASTYRELIEKYPRNVGVAQLGREISIREVDDRTKECPPGKPGVIYGRGPGTHLGYYKSEEGNRNTFLPDGWQTSEDTGYIDPETGLLYVFDRVKDVICTGGEMVSSVEVEEVVLRHPAVAECAVIGIPDLRLQERVTAIVVLKPGPTATPGEIEKFCKGKIAGLKRPRLVEIVDSIPKNPVGKILKKELREPYWKGYETRVMGR